MKNDDILIFRTSILKTEDLIKVDMLFTQYPQIHKWNVDLEDWEKVLRIESQELTVTEIIEALRSIQIEASEL